MKKKNRGFLLTSAALIMALLLAGCGASSDKAFSAVETAATADFSGAARYDNLYAEAPMEEMKEEAVAEEAAEAEAGAGEVKEQAQENTERKLIKNVDMSVETESFDILMNNIEAKVEMLGGYIEQSDVYNGSYTSNYRSRNASLKIRIPSEKLDGFVDEIAEQTNITNKSESVEDVTLRYVDLESHKKALRAEEESLLLMLEKAETIADIIAIQSQLTDVRYQIESMESQLRTYDNKIQYSTIWLYINEVAQYEPYEPKTPGQRISEGFMRNVHNVMDGIENFFIELIIAIPLLIVAAIVIGIGILVVVAVVKITDKRAKKKREQIEQIKREREIKKPDGE